MDERLFKSAVESIEMPDDMKDRIIENCRSGEAKPLFIPKKRFVYMPMAVTACVCVLVAALAGVGVWQLKVLSDNSDRPPASDSGDIGIEPSEDTHIIAIPLSEYDLETAGYWKEKPDPDDHIKMTEEELSEYYGIDVTHLLYGLGIKPSVYEADSDGPGLGIYRADGGTGEIIFDTNCFLYGEKGEITINISKLAIPFSIPKLWSDGEQLSVIRGGTAAVGTTLEYMRSIVEFKLEQYGLYFNVWCEQDMVVDVVSAIMEQCDLQLSEDNQPVQTGEPLTLDKLREICSGDCSKLSWDDFKQYQATEIGSGLYIYQYDIEGRYTLLIGGVPEDEPYYMIFSTLIGEEQGIDIRKGGLEDYLDLHAGTTMTHTPLTLAKLREICAGDTSSLSWSDFRQFESTSWGSGLLYLEYDIEGKYTLTVGGNPNEAPYIMELYVPGQYYAIDIREDSIDEYLNEPIPEGDVINVIPLTWQDIRKHNENANAGQVDEVYLTDKQLTEYYGIDITSFGGMPEGFRAAEDDVLRYVLVDRNSGGTVYYDINGFNYTSPYRTGMITVSVGTLPNHIDKLGEDRKMRSRIGGRIVAIGQTEDGHYEVELLSADSVLGLEISADGISLEELCKVIAALVEQTEVRDCVNEDCPYPWLYIDSITAGDDTVQSELSQTVPEDALNNAAAYGKLNWPTNGGYISEYGYWDGGYTVHTGIDIAGIESGAPVYAGADGVVTYAGWDNSLGYYVEIYHPDLGISSGYAHNSAVYVSVGQHVARGDRIAGAGETGQALGVQIHLLVKVNGVNVNPKDYLSRTITGSDR